MVPIVAARDCKPSTATSAPLSKPITMPIAKTIVSEPGHPNPSLPLVVATLTYPLISNDLEKPAERPALRYGLGEAGHERG